MLNKLKYRRYEKQAKSAKTLQQIRDVLYTFLSYYRQLGKQPALTKTGVDYLRIADAFQSVIHKYNLSKPLSQLKLKQLKPACKTSMKVVAMEFYAERNDLRIQTIDVQHIRKVKKAMAQVQGVLNRIKRNRDLCLGLHISNTSVTLMTVPHDKVVPISKSKGKSKRDKKSHKNKKGSEK